VAVSGVTSWSPAVVGLWGEGTGMAGGSSGASETVWQPRRRWRLAVQLGPLLPRADGATDPRDPTGLAGLLWDAWRSGTPLAFRDVDAAPGTTQLVQLVGLEERLGGVAPGEARRLDLELVEVG